MAKTAGRIRVETGRKRVRAYLGGELVADTRQPVLVWEWPYFPAYYFPAADVRAKLVARRPDRALAEPGRRGDLPRAGCPGPPRSRRPCATRTRRWRTCATLVRLDWDAMSEWFEEDEPVYTHPRDPYSRVDILASSRHVRVEVDGVTVADSRQPRILFETGLPPRYYLPLTDVRMDLLRPVGHPDTLPVQGHRRRTGRCRPVSSCTPTSCGSTAPRCRRARRSPGLACFYDEKVDVYLDGELQPRPRTHFS